MEKIEVVSCAFARYIRVSPRKVRLVIDLIRGKKVNQALLILASINKKAKENVEKALRSAISNAKRNPQVKVNELFISKITACNGPMLKRYRAASMGRGTMIRHRTTHITIELANLKQEGLKVERKRFKAKEKQLRKV